MLATTNIFRPYSTNPGCRIIVDSCSSVSVEFAQEHGVDILEFPYVLAGQERRCDQWESLDERGFYDRMRAGDRAMTSAVPTGEFIELFRGCAREGVPTVFFSLTGGLSSSVRDAEQAASLVNSEAHEAKVYVVDNRAPSLCALLVTDEACRMRDRGSSAEEIAAWAAKAPDCLHGYFTLDSLRWLALGGRIPKAAASLSTVLDVKANLTFDLDGALTLMGITRGRKKGIKAVLSSLDANYRTIPSVDGTARPLAIADADCTEDADKLEEGVREWFANKGWECPTIFRASVDPTIGSHVGPGMLALSFWGVDRRQTGWNSGKR